MDTQITLYMPDPASLRVIECSPPSWMIQLALEEKELPYETRLLSFSAGEHRSPEMLARNPRGTVPVLTDGLARTYDKTLDAPTFVFERGDDRYPIKDKAVQPGVPAILGGGAIEIRPVDLPLRSWAPMLTPEMLTELRKLADAKVASAAPGKAADAARAARENQWQVLL